jgi:hypothetical protein
MAGTFAPSDELRALAWGVDGTALAVANALLTVRYLRRGNDLAAAGFLVFAIGEALILSGSAMDIAASPPVFAAGVALWSASMVLVGASGAMPRWVNAVGFVGAVLFTVVALQIFLGSPLTALSQPLPFFAYPFLVAVLVGWAWALHRNAS